MLSMSRTTTPIVLVPEERATLDAWARGRNLPYRKVIRARIITMAADGVLNQDIANALSVSRPTVQLWRERFLALRLRGLEKDAPRPGRKPKVSARKIRAVVEDTVHSPAPNATHWSTGSMAKAHGLSQTMV
jgi:transposase